MAQTRLSVIRGIVISRSFIWFQTATLEGFSDSLVYDVPGRFGLILPLAGRELNRRSIARSFLPTEASGQHVPMKQNP